MTQRDVGVSWHIEHHGAVVALGGGAYLVCRRCGSIWVWESSRERGVPGGWRQYIEEELTAASA